MKRGQITIFIIIGFLLLLTVSLTMYITSVTSEKRSERALYQAFTKPERVPIIDNKCPDGTKFNACAKTRPFRCVLGALLPSCNRCGCSGDEVCNFDGTCSKPSIEAVPISEPVKISYPPFVVYFLPINYPSHNDPDFLDRVEKYKESLLRTNLMPENLQVVDKVWNYPVSRCGTAVDAMPVFVEQWFQERTGFVLKGMDVKKGVPIFNFRVIGVDSQAQNDQQLKNCGCGYSMMFKPYIWIGGHNCSRVPHVALHELGHTFGLCDEYDTCTWIETNSFLDQRYGRGCPNVKPDGDNSDCGVKCCAQDKACCLGKFADVRKEDMFNVMGSADKGSKRRIGSETSAVLNDFLCSNFQRCG